MTMGDDTEHGIDTDELVAFAEGRLPAGSRAHARVEAHLHRYPEDAARVEAYRQQDALIREAYGDVAHQPLPERLLPGEGGARARAWPAVGMAAALVVGIASGWLAARMTADPLSHPAMHAFAERVAGRLTSPDAGMTRASDTAARATGEAPDLAAAGLQRVGSGRAADMQADVRRFEYRDPSGTPIHLFVSRDIARTTPAVRVVSSGGYAVAYWHRARTTYALAGMVSPGSLKEMAREVVGALDERPRQVRADPAGPDVGGEPGSGDEVIAVTPESNGNGSEGLAPESGATTVPDEM